MMDKIRIALAALLRRLALRVDSPVQRTRERRTGQSTSKIKDFKYDKK